MPEKCQVTWNSRNPGLARRALGGVKAAYDIEGFYMVMTKSYCLFENSYQTFGVYKRSSW